MTEYHSEEEAMAAWKDEQAWNDKQAWEASESARGEFDAQQQAEEEGKRLELEGCAAEHEDEAPSEYEKLRDAIRNMFNNAICFGHYSDKQTWIEGKDVALDDYTSEILSIIAERCVIVDAKPNDIDEAFLSQATREMLFAFRKHGGDLNYCVNEIRKDFEKAGWRPVKEIKKEAK